jgi:RimJ/RimL family protein N-acetyltransferase
VYRWNGEKKKELKRIPLSNSLITLEPLLSTHFEVVYSVATDPLIWEQHPNSDRYKREVFEAFFQEALETKNAFLIKDNVSDKVIGCTRFYEYNKEKKYIAIGYTFFDRAYWGGVYNKSVKYLMMDYAFEFVDTIFYHVGITNIRSQKALEKIGIHKSVINEEKNSITFAISKSQFQSLNLGLESTYI